MGCARCDTTRTAGLSTFAAGLGLIGAGLWARREVRLGLERERITAPGAKPGTHITDAGEARSLAETIRESTLSSTEGRTYSETPAYVDPQGEPTDDKNVAAKDPLTGEPVESPAHDLWLQATTLQTALVQAYLAQRLAELTVGVGAVFTVVGAGLAARPRR